MQTTKNILKTMIPLAVVITLLSGLLYATMQQVLRKYANDPQIQMAEDAAAALANGKPIDSVVPNAQIDIATSIAPYIVVFDNSGKAIASSGLLHNQLPALPSGIFDYVRQNGEDRITWQPEPGVRSATVVTRFGGAQPGFVVAGRSLRESENRTDELGIIIAFGWLGTLFAALVAVSLSELLLASDSPLLRWVPPLVNKSMRARTETSQPLTNKTL
jgi:hypothetical protein